MKISGRFKNIFANVVQGLFILLVIWGETVGIYHAAKKHNEFWLATTIPPVAWYRSIEIFWHNDFAGINWDKENRSMAKIVKNILDASCDKDVDQIQVNDRIDSFSKRYSKYPEKKRTFTMGLARKYINYIALMYEDLLAGSNESLSSGKIKFFYGKETLQVQTALKNEYYLKEEIELEDEALKKLLDNVKPDSDQLEQFRQSEQSRTLFAEGIKLQNKKNMTALKVAYEKMFGEAY